MPAPCSHRAQWHSRSAISLLLAALLLAGSAGTAAAANGGTGGGMPGGLVTVFAAECNDYMDWQSIAVVYTHRKSKVPGPIYRILTCDEASRKAYTNLDIVPTHLSPSWTFNKHNQDAYLAYNKPGALIDWLEKAPPQQDWVLVIDPDMPSVIIRDSFQEWGRVYGADRGWAVSLYFGYMQGVANNLSATHVPEIPPRQDVLAGPRGRRGDMASGVVLMHRDDLQRVAPLWMHYSEVVRDDPLGFNETGDEYAKQWGQKAWISEMYGYSFGAAKAGVWHHVDYTAQLYPGYQPWDKPLILHYGRLWQVGAWSFQKHWLRTFKALQCPPWPHMDLLLTGRDVAEKVAGGLFPPPPHPSKFADLPPPQRYKELLSIQVIATVNAALCEKHLVTCPPSTELTEQCDKVKQLEQAVDSALSEVESSPDICTDRKAATECRKWAAKQLCSQDPGFMHNWCRETCGMCRLPSGRREASWGESLPGWTRRKGGRRGELPHWTEGLDTGGVHRMHLDRGGNEEGTDGGGKDEEGGGGRELEMSSGGGRPAALYASALVGWALLLLGGVLGLLLRGWWARRRSRREQGGVSRLPVLGQGRWRRSSGSGGAGAALLG